MILELFPETYSVCRLEAGTAIPAWARGRFASVTTSDEELSVICATAGVPDGVEHDSGWRCLRIAGALDLGAIGVLLRLTSVLAGAGVSILAVGTYRTDYLLVPDADLGTTISALEADGITVEPLGGGLPATDRSA